MFGGGRGSDRQKQTADEHSTGLNNSTNHIFTQLYSKMKSALTLVISSFFLIGVFGETVTVMEGNSVTLYTDRTEIQRDDSIEWKLNGVRRAKISTDSSGVISVWVSSDEAFRDRLHLDRQTGDLKITKFKTTDSGQYLLKFRSIRGSSDTKFNVSVISSGLESVSVMEGDSFSLKSGLTEIQRDDEIRWSFKNNSIAEIIKADKRFPTSNNERFRDRLKLDEKTGSLTITNTRITDSGEYEVEISTNRFTVHKRISVTIDERKSVSVTEGDSVTLISGLTEIQRDAEIRWSFKKTTIITTTDDDDLDGRFRDRLKLDHRTGSLTITNTRTTDSGEYQVEISTNRFTIHKRISVTVNEVVNSVLVKEGDSVTLHTNASISRDDAVLWYGDKGVRITPSPGSVDARWKNTVQNGQTGDLTIRNIRRDQSGDYKVFFMNINGGSKHKKFHINITEIVNSVLVMEGDSVTLHIDAPIPRHDAVLWYGDNDTLITGPVDARWSNTDHNDRTGDLTIRNIRGDQSGDYKIVFTNIQMFSTRIHRKFHIIISDVFSDETDGVKTVSVIKGDSVFLDTSVTEIQNGDLIEWLFQSYFIIAKTDGNSNSIYNENYVRFKNRLNLDIRTGDLTIKNCNSEDSGRYQLKIISSTYTIQKSFSVTVNSDLSSVVPDSGQSSAVPGSCLSPGAVVGIVIAVIAVLLVAAAVGGLIYYCLKSSKPERSREVNGQNHTSNKDVDTELTEPPKAAEQQQFI